MYVSHLLIDVGDNPDRPRPGRLWLRNVYHVHQRLSMAFPAPRTRDDDPRFLRPFDPDRFEKPRFLFRIDNAIRDNTPRAMIVVQSRALPDWEYAFHNADMFLAVAPEVGSFDFSCNSGDKYGFRILMNLSKKIKTSRDGKDLRKQGDKTDAEGRPKSQSKRVSLTWESEEKNPEDVIVPWFAAKGIIKTAEGEKKAYGLRSCRVLRTGWTYGTKPKTARSGAEHGLKFRSALLEGTLEVEDTQAFARLVGDGIGAGKAFGFGLLSITGGG